MAKQAEKIPPIRGQKQLFSELRGGESDSDILDPGLSVCGIQQSRKADSVSIFVQIPCLIMKTMS